MSGPSRRQGLVFISVAEGEKERLGRPFRSYLEDHGIHGYIVSDEPLIEHAWTPEEKVDAYLDKSQAVIVLATADLSVGSDLYTRPNIADEIARARSKTHLRDRVCVLKETGVTLPSNINPAYEHLERKNVEPAFEKALRQLQEWGVGGGTPTRHRQVDQPATVAPSTDGPELLQRALDRMPDIRHTAGSPTLAVVLVSGPHQAVLRPAEIERKSLADELARLALEPNPSVFDPSRPTQSGMSGNSLLIEQAPAWFALDSEGTLVISTPLKSGDRVGLPVVIEEEVYVGLVTDLTFARSVLDLINSDRSLRRIVPVALLVAAGFVPWRTRAEHAASPHSITLRSSGSDREVARLSPPMRERDALDGTA